MSLLLDALHCQNKEGRPPIWLMRQAGRYLPEYQAIKKKRKLFDLFHDLEAIVQITKLPIDILQVDAAILFSDILTVLEGLSLRYDFQEKVGPVIYDSPSKIVPREAREVYSHIFQSIRLLKQELSVPLIGFAGAPFTVAAYLIEGGSSKDYKRTKQWLYRRPESFQSILDQVTQATIDYIDCQIEAGVDAIQLFDSWANRLGIWEFRQFCLKPMEKITSAVKKRGIPLILFCLGSSLFAPDLASLNPSAISIDWSGDLPSLRHQIPSHIALQGNLDPMVLYGSRERIRLAVDRLLQPLQDEPGYIFNLGHGMLPDIDVDQVKFLVDYVHSL
ncbi:MAG: uroporphyrinogen decarboxylase [Chlamydiales bacterium]